MNIHNTSDWVYTVCCMFNHSFFRSYIFSFIFLLFIGFTPLAQGISPQVDGSIRITDIGTFDTAKSQLYADINNEGAVVGIERNGQHVVWKDGLTKELDAKITEAYAINDNGVIAVRYEDRNGTMKAGVYGKGKRMNIIGLTKGYSAAVDISNDGTVIGWSEKNSHASTIYQGFKAERKRAQRIPSPSKSKDTVYPTALNEQKIIVGYFRTAENPSSQAFFWSKADGFRTIIQSEWERSAAYGINDIGVIIGDFTAKGQTAVQPFIMENNSIAQLAITEEFSGATARAINNQNDVVGQAWYKGEGFTFDRVYREDFWRRTKATDTAAVVWSNGQMIDLNRYTTDENLKLFTAVAINDHGQLLALGWHTQLDKPHVYLIELPKNIPPPLR